MAKGTHVVISAGENGPELQVISNGTDGVQREHVTDLALRAYERLLQIHGISQLALEAARESDSD